MADLSALYPQAPQAPQQQQSLLSGNPLNTITALYGVTRLQQARQQLQATQAMSRALSNTMNSDGSANFDAAQKQLLTDPSGGPAAATALPDILSMKNQAIANGTAQLIQQGTRMDVIGRVAGSLATKKDLNPNDLDNFVTFAVGHGGDPAKFWAFRHALGNNMDNARTGLTQFWKMGLGAAGQAQPQEILGPGGGRQVITTGQYLEGTTGGGGQIPGVPGGAMPTGLPPGYAERQAGAAQIDTQLSRNLADAAEGSPSRIGLLGNLSDAVDKFTSGPGADWTKVAKAFINRNVPLPSGWQFSPQSIASQEEFNKQAMQLAQQQFQSIGGTGTDAKFSSAFQTSPNETLSGLGNKGIIRLLQGNEDALQTKNRAWLSQVQANPSLSYRQFSQEFNNHFDPRVFQFAHMADAERKQYMAKLPASDQRQLATAIAFARKNNWVGY